MARTRRSQFNSDDLLRCGCGYENDFFRVYGHRGHSKNPLCKAEPVVIGKVSAAAPHYATAPPPEPLETPSLNVFDAGGYFDGAGELPPDPPDPPDVSDATAPPPPPGRMAGMRMIPPPPVNGHGPPPPPQVQTTVAVSPRVLMWFDMARQQGYTGSMSAFVDEGVDGYFKFKGWRLGILPKDAVVIPREALTYGNAPS